MVESRSWWTSNGQSTPDRANESGDSCTNHCPKQHRGADTGAPEWEEEDGCLSKGKEEEGGDGIQSFRQEGWALLL